MKKTFAFILIFLLAVSIVGCSSKTGTSKETPVEIVSKEIEQMPDYIANYLKEQKQTETYQAFDLNGSILLFAARGEMSTGGYEISFGKAVVKEGKLVVEVNRTDPKNGEVVAQVITYPVALGKVSGENNVKKIVFVDGSNNKKILKEVEVKEIPQPEESVVTLYFGTKDGYLRKELRTISGLPTADRGKELIEELIKGTTAEDDTLNVLPQGTKVLDYKFDAEKGLATVDLSEQVYAATGSMGEIFAVYSIVNTLTELPGIEKVQFLVEGKVVETIAGHIYLKEPVERDLQLMEGNLLK